MNIHTNTCSQLDDQQLKARCELAFAEGEAEAKKAWEAEHLALTVQIGELQAEVSINRPYEIDSIEDRFKSTWF